MLAEAENRPMPEPAQSEHQRQISPARSHPKLVKERSTGSHLE
jgi:hypothetical protein